MPGHAPLPIPKGRNLLSLQYQVGIKTLPTIPGRWCFIDGSWKNKDIRSGQGWYSTLEGFDGLMGARNTIASLSPLHAEVEALIWVMECMRNLR